MSNVLQVADLDFEYPSELVATEPSRPTRVAFFANAHWSELALAELLDQFRSGDLLVINESKVIPARIFTEGEIEILFLRQQATAQWQVLFPAREFKIGDTLVLPEGLKAELVSKGLPQVLQLSRPIDFEYFERYGEVALPPYIQEARGERHNRSSDLSSYQASWARQPGSVAAPTASLHFSEQDLNQLQKRGVGLARLTLHVGAGTFLPIKTSNLDQHVMHSEIVEIPVATLNLVRETLRRGSRIWALGTTVTRALEAWANGDLEETERGAFGETRIFIKPGYQFKVVSGLLTNFHQPKSTLISLVAAFAGLENVKKVYAWAIERRFKLFSYGDLSAWIK